MERYYRKKIKITNSNYRSIPMLELEKKKSAKEIIVHVNGILLNFP